MTKNFGPEFGQLFQTAVPSFAPGQAMFLINFSESDLLTYEADGPNSKRASGTKTEVLPILIEYDGPWSGLHRVVRLWSHVRKRRQYAYLYRFNPLSVMTDLPPPEAL